MERGGLKGVLRRITEYHHEMKKKEINFVVTLPLICRKCRKQ